MPKALGSSSTASPLPMGTMSRMRGGASSSCRAVLLVEVEGPAVLAFPCGTDQQGATRVTSEAPPSGAVDLGRRLGISSST